MVSDTPLFFIYLSFSFHITSNLLIFIRLSVKAFFINDISRRFQ